MKFQNKTVLLYLNNVSTSIIKKRANFIEELLAFLVERRPFIQIILVHIELSNDFLDAIQPVVDSWVVCHA